MTESNTPIPETSAAEPSAPAAEPAGATLPQTPSTVILMKDVVSQETVMGDGEPIPLLRGIDLEIGAGEVWGVGASDKRMVDILCRIAGNMIPYYSGKCRVGAIGTPKKKRRIQSHLFLIAAPEMLIDTLTVLEQLLLATMKLPGPKDAAERQEEALNLLERVGLAHVALMPITQLYDAEVLLVELLIAALSEAQIIVFNILEYPFEQRQIESLVKLAAFAREAGKTLVIGTAQPKIIGMACDHVAFLHGGKVRFSGTVEALTAHADHVCFVLHEQNAKEMAARIEALRGDWKCDVEGDSIYVFSNGKREDAADFYRFLADNGLDPDSVKVNRGRVENSFFELAREI